MKEQFALFKSGLCSFFKRKLKAGLVNLYHAFGLCFYKKKTEESESLFIPLLALLKRHLERRKRFALIALLKVIIVIDYKDMMLA